MKKLQGIMGWAILLMGVQAPAWTEPPAEVTKVTIPLGSPKSMPDSIGSLRWRCERTFNAHRVGSSAMLGICIFSSAVSVLTGRPGWRNARRITKPATGAAQRFPKAKKYNDFRRVFDSPKDFDAVMISTAEHTHTLAAYLALTHGKHVYCEKPLHGLDRQGMTDVQNLEHDIVVVAAEVAHRAVPRWFDSVTQPEYRKFEPGAGPSPLHAWIHSV